MFAGSCIGVICLVISLEFLRRVQREYDGYVRRQDQKAYTASLNRTGSTPASSERGIEDGKNASVDSHPLGAPTPTRPHIKRVTLLQRQLLRSLLHMLQFGVAYFVMLLAMYYNGQPYFRTRSSITDPGQATSSSVSSSEHSLGLSYSAGISFSTKSSK